MRRYILIKHSEKFGAICVFDNKFGKAFAANQAMWMALEFEEI